VSLPLADAEEQELADLLEEAWQLRASEAPARRRRKS
jgi:hypothetical protein